MKSKAQIFDDINNLISFIQKNKQSLASNSNSNCYDRGILTIKESFYTIANDLSSEFTEPELNKIENDLIFYYESLKEIIDLIQSRHQINSYPKVKDPDIYSNLPFSNPDSYSNLPFNIHVINKEDIDHYTIHIQRRIEGIKKDIEKNKKLQPQNMAEIYQLYNCLADNLDQQTMAMDELLYDRQTQRHEATIKNIINVLDGV